MLGVTHVKVQQGWHADIAVYIATAYVVYYIWHCNVWEKILPRLNFNINLAGEEKKKFERLNNKKADIGVWGEPNDEDKPNDQVLHACPRNAFVSLPSHRHALPNDKGLGRICCGFAVRRARRSSLPSRRV